MTVRPIIFSAPMVRALLDGRKTQTRRVLKPQPRIFKNASKPYRPHPQIAPREWVWLLGSRVHCICTVPYAPGDLLIPALPIPSLNRLYCADIQGNVWSRAKGEWHRLVGSPTTRGYLSVTPAIGGAYKTRLVHRLVCEAYYGPQPDGLAQVRHLDGDRMNNAPENLDWGTQKQNWSDRAAHGTGMGEQHHAAKLNREQVKAIRARKGEIGQRALAAEYGVAQSQIWSATNGKTWGDPAPACPPNMPRWASRLTLRVTDVRVQRVRDVTISDCADEGVLWNRAEDHSRKESFARFWNTLHKPPHDWSGNPWVAALTFDVIRKNVDEVEP